MGMSCQSIIKVKDNAHKWHSILSPFTLQLANFHTNAAKEKIAAAAMLCCGRALAIVKSGTKHS